MIGAGLTLLLLAQATGDAGTQEQFDADAARMAARVRGDFADEGSELLPSPALALDARRHPWRAVTDAQLRARSSYRSPPAYRFHRSAIADVDRDGWPDRVEMVENDRQQALRITYGAAGKAPRIVARNEGRWSDQGLFAAGPHAVMINYPESRVYFLFERAGQVRAVFVGN